MRVTILCGIPGSGKSTYAARELPQAQVASADRYPGIYDEAGTFHPELLPRAHSACLKGFITACQEQVDELVVDNTNTTTAEVAPYAAVALAYGYTLQIVVLEVSPEVAFSRNIHGVSLKACQMMADRLAKLDTPPWWPVQRLPG